MSRLAFVTNMCPHYRVRTFETLAARRDTDFYFFSAGDDWYWMHRVHAGNFQSYAVPGIRIGGTRVNPSLPVALWRGGYDAYIKCINGRFALPATYLVARLTGRPFILWTGVWMRLRTPAHRMFYLITRYIYRHADAVVVYGPHVKRFLESEGVAPERIFVAPHAVDNAAYNRRVDAGEIAEIRQTLEVPSGNKIALFIGRLEDGKGLDVLVRAFASLRRTDTTLVLAGDGSEREALEQLAAELGVADRVRFPGYVQPADTVAYYAAAWVYILPSVTTARFKEPWGLVVNEAFNQGLPVIATDAVGAAAGGLVKDGETGLVVPEDDASALAAAMARVLDDAGVRDDLGRRARAAIDNWNNDRMVDGFLQAVDAVLQPRTDRR